MAQAKISSSSVQNTSIPEHFILAKICDSFLSRLKGFMFQHSIQPAEALLFINNNESRMDAAIHMLFMNFDIAVFWLDGQNRIVDKKIAKKWQLMYYPQRPAKMILETHPEQYPKFDIGDQLIIEVR